MNKLTEAEKGKVIDYLLNQNNGSYKDLAEDSFDEGYSLSRKQVIEEVEEWRNNKRKSLGKINDEHNEKIGKMIILDDLLTKLQTLK